MRVGKIFWPTRGRAFFHHRQAHIASRKLPSGYDERASGTAIYAYVGNDPTDKTDPTGLVADPNDCDRQSGCHPGYGQTNGCNFSNGCSVYSCNDCKSGQGATGNDSGQTNDPCSGQPNCTSNPNGFAHDNGDCALYGCDDVKGKDAGDPNMGVSGAAGWIGGIATELSSDGSKYFGAGLVFGLSAKGMLKPGTDGAWSKDMLDTKVDHSPYGWVMRIDVSGGEDFGGGATIYIKPSGASVNISTGPAEGLSGSVTLGYRSKPTKKDH